MNKPGDGTFALSERFRDAAELAAKTRLEAPARVQPTGSATIAESLQNLAAASQTLEAMQPEMASLDLSQHTFPHPYFGDLTAAEWLVIAGAHELRHTLQIQQVFRAGPPLNAQKNPGQKEGDPTGERALNTIIIAIQLNACSKPIIG